MFLKLILTTVIALGSFFVQPVSAKEEAILFWGTTCPYCHTVREKIEEEGLYEKIDITELEVSENRDNVSIFYEKIGVCKINANNAGIPLLFADNQCYVGVDPIMNKLNSMVNAEVLGNEEVITEGKESDGKKNTEKLIWGGVVGLVLLVVLGYFLEKKKGVNVLMFFLLVGLGSFFANPVSAMCPVCTVAVGAGLGLSRYLGIDDLITGIWIGGLVVSSLMWFISWLKGKGKDSLTVKTLVVSSMYAVLVLTLYVLDFLGHPLNRLWGVDKILMGIVLGSVSFFFAAKFHLYLKDRNKGKVFIPFQKVVFTVGALLLMTVIFYFILY